MAKDFKFPVIVSIFLLIAAAIYGWYSTHTMLGSAQFFFTAMVLALLELSLSFDNAVVNATILKDMTPKWQKIFLTWGILIAVFGMRLIFPVAIVSAVISINPYDALILAFNEPAKYAEAINSSEHLLAGFGGTFLLLVCLNFFLDHEKETHWFHEIESRLALLGRLPTVSFTLSLILILVLTVYLPADKALGFLQAAVLGLITYAAIELIGHALKLSEGTMKTGERASIGMFIYLEILDASFSFDGVIGAFAITTNFVIIAIGLGIGALFVRGLTVLMVNKGVLEAYRYLEHGAFYALGVLAFLIYLSLFIHVPEYITGGLSVAVVGLSVWSSIASRKVKV